MDDPYQDNSFEKVPGSNLGEVSAEQLERAAEWESVMSEDVPEFAGDKFGNANETNEFYGEMISSGAEEDGVEAIEVDDGGIDSAMALINYGLEAATRQYGVENVIQKLKGFDASGSSDPIVDFYRYLGIDNKKEQDDFNDLNRAITEEENFREATKMTSRKKSVEGAFKAISDMKELIAEVEGADPRYAELREEARRTGKGYFETAVSASGSQSLVELFQVLKAQREKAEDSENEGGGEISGAVEANGGGSNAEEVKDVEGEL